MTEVILKEDFKRFACESCSRFKGACADCSNCLGYTYYEKAWIAAEQAMIAKEKEKRCGNCQHVKLGRPVSQCTHTSIECSLLSDVSNYFYCKNFQERKK